MLKADPSVKSPVKFFEVQAQFPQQCSVSLDLKPCEIKTHRDTETITRRNTREREVARQLPALNKVFGPKTETEHYSEKRKITIQRDYIACQVDLNGSAQQELKIFTGHESAIAVSGLTSEQGDSFKLVGPAKEKDFLFKYQPKSNFGKNLWVCEDEHASKLNIDEASTADVDFDGDRDVVLQVGGEFLVLENLRVAPPLELFSLGALLSYTLVFPFFPDLEQAVKGTCFWQTYFSEPNTSFS